MRKIFLLSLFFIISSNAFCQNGYPKQEQVKALIISKDYEKALVLVTASLLNDSLNKDALLDECNVLQSLGRFTEAAGVAKELVRLFPQISSNYILAGWCYLISKQYQKAKYYCTKAVDLRPFDYNAYLNLAHVYLAIKDLKLADFYYRMSLEFVCSEDQLQSIISDVKLLQLKGIANIPNDNTIDDFNYIHKEYGKNTAATRLLDSITSLLITEQFTLTDPVITKLMEKFISEETPSEFWRYHVMMKCYWNLGDVQFKRRNTVKARKNFYRNSLEISESFRDTVARIHQLLNISDLYKETYSKYLALRLAFASNDTISQTKCFLNLSNFYRDAFRWDSSYYYALRAFKLAEQLKDENLTFRTADAMFGNMDVRRDYDSATIFYRILYDAISETGNTEDRFALDKNYMRLLFRVKHFNECISYINKLYDQYSSKKTRDVSEFDETIGLCYYELKNNVKAEAYFKKSISVYSQYLFENASDPGLELMSTERSISLEYLKRVYCSNHDGPKLFNISEQSKANLLYKHFFNTSVPNTVLNIKHVQANMDEDEAVISFSGSSSMNYGYAVAFDKKKIISMVENTADLDKLLADPADALFKQNVVLAMHNLRKKFVNAVADTKENSASAVLLFASLLQVKAIGSSKQFSRGADEVIDTSVSKITETGVANNILYKWYIEPFKSILANKKTIYISTDLITSLLSFDALKDSSGTYLGALYNIVYVPSFTAQQELMKVAAPPGNAMLAIGNPAYKNFDQGKMEGRAYDFSVDHKIKWEDLPGTKNELDAIKKIIPSAEILEGVAVNESMINGLNNNGKLQGYKYLHFATHGVTSFVNYEDNSLILTEQPGTNYDGFLQFSEIAHLSLKAKLVCLSACESAVGETKDNNDYNLTTAFLLAGAKSVIASSWKIDDIATGLFMSEFYKKLVNDKLPVSEALHVTKLQFIKGEFGEAYKSPTIWAAFKYVGY